MRRRIPAGSAYAIAYLGVLLVLLWARAPHAIYLIAAAAATVAFPILARRSVEEPRAAPPRGPLLGAAAMLLVAIGIGALVQSQLSRLASDWRPLVAEREARLRTELSRGMEVLVARTRRTAVLASRVAARDREVAAGDSADERRLFADLDELRRRSDVAALAVFDSTGALIAWSGVHYGPVPAELLNEASRFVYAERPLFSYLYISAELPGGGAHAVAAVLLQSTVADAAQDAGYAARFEKRTGARPYFAASSDSASWALVSRGDTIFAGRFEPLTQADWHDRTARLGGRAAILFALVALGLLIAGWLSWSRGRSRRLSGVPLAALAPALAVAPLGADAGLDRVFPPLFFLLPAPGDISLTTLLAALLPVAALVATRRAPFIARRKVPGALLIGALAIAIGFSGGIRLMLAGATPQLLLGGVHLWGGLQIASVLLLAVLPALAFPCTADDEPSLRKPLVLGGMAICILLALVVVGRWHGPGDYDPWTAALWAAPYYLIARGASTVRGRGGQLLRWMLAAFLAATAVIPHVWLAHLDARFEAAEREIGTLGARPDPYVEALLRRFAEEAELRADRGEDGTELLYRSWLASGLAREGVPVELDLWSRMGESIARLRLGGPLDAGHAADPPQWFVGWVAARAIREGVPVVETSTQAPGVNQMLAAPFADGRLVTVVVPPRRTLGHSTVLAPLLGDETRSDTRLTLVPVRTEQPEEIGGVHWIPSERGWRSETRLRFPEGEYHGHLEVRVAGRAVRIARALLLLFSDLSLLGLLWLLGGLARGALPAPAGGWRAWGGTFQARVTLALFVFFLIPTVAFGTIAYRALASDVSRVAGVLADHAVAQAATMFPDSLQDLGVVANRVGEEVLYYQGGELLAASTPEAVDLGLYGAWLPAEVYLTLRSGEETSIAELQGVGRHALLTAYHASAPAGTIAVPVSLERGEIAARQRELTDVILFAALIGGLLSLALSVAVGRALARPIGTLSRVAAAIGAGRLRVRLPEDRNDEFGGLYASFNRMVRRLRRARAREARTQRVLAWGEMARQVAHEIKNPLTPIKLSVQHLRRAFADRRPDFGEILDTNVDQILLEIDRLSEIARAFSRYGAPTLARGPLEEVDVHAVVREALALYRTDAAIRYSTEVEPALPRVLARSGELKEVLLNLLENARNALVDGGQVFVVARRTDHHIELSVEDDGVGIPREAMERIFDPHFSTTSGGTGLGLAIVRRLVESWGGSVAAESRVGEGTAVRVRMRAVAGEEDELL